MKLFTRYFTVAALVACLHSCDSPELVRKRDQQSIEITKLKGELAIVEEKLKDVPPDRSKELATIEEEAKIQAVIDLIDSGINLFQAEPLLDSFE